MGKSADKKERRKEGSGNPLSIFLIFSRGLSLITNI